MECEVRISRVQGEGKFHASLVSLEDDGDVCQLVCLIKNHITPVRVNVSDKCIRKIVDPRADVGVVSIQLSEYHSNGVKEIYIKNSKPTDLKHIIKRIRSLLPAIATGPSPSSCKRYNNNIMNNY